jgi:UDP-N-acetylglucosamine--N-acetylmuramyl-(pentapeptide) pyrophosphoryl-undecaprenol N-acetylglucosamine transferase
MKLYRFLHSMDLAYAAADLIVSRAGAMTCSEILATGKSAILVNREIFFPFLF